jgi:hypothetical protein
VLAARAAGGREAAPFTIGRAPDWVTTADPDLHAPADAGTGGRRVLLYDRQVRVTAHDRESYSRWVVRIENEAGLHAASQVVVEVDPAIQTTTLHHVRVLRGDERFDRLDRDDVKVVQREPNLERQIYDGRKAALLFLKDLRVGDVVDYAFTVRGIDPMLADRYVDAFVLSGQEPMARRRIRLLVPSTRRLRFVTHGPADEGQTSEPLVTPRGDETEYVWDDRDVPKHTAEPDAPAWWDPFRWLQVSEFASWDEVARWGADVFAVEALRAGPVRDWVDHARAAAAAALDDFLLRAARFVQDEIRYVGIETGVGRRKPTSPATVFERRYGDCKDKAAILVAMLRAGGREAWPALVSTTRGHVLDGDVPSPNAFDHVIVKVEALDGGIYWIDPTVALEGGTVERWRRSPYERALVLDSRTTTLARLVDEPVDRPALRVRDHWVVATPGTPAETRVDSERVYEGALADRIRASLRAGPTDQVSKTYLQLFKDDFPSVREAAPIEQTDDRDANVLRIVVHLSVRDFWTWSETEQRWSVELPPRTIHQYLRRPSIDGRGAPVAMPYPLTVEQAIVLELPFDLPGEPDTSIVDGPTFRVRFDSAHDGRTLTYRYQLTTSANAVAAKDLDAHVAAIDKMRQSTRVLRYRKGGMAAINWAAVVALLGFAPFVVWGARRAYRFEPSGAPVAPDAPPTYLRGWLRLLGLGLLVGVLASAVVLVHASDTVLSLAVWRALTTPELRTFQPGVALLAVAELLVQLAFLAYGVVLVLLFFQTRRSFPWHFTRYMIAVLVFVVVDHLTAARLATTPKDDPTFWIRFAYQSVGSLIWVAYLQRSRRAAATFVH